jgi:hypothetical protein
MERSIRTTTPPTEGTCRQDDCQDLARALEAALAGRQLCAVAEMVAEQAIWYVVGGPLAGRYRGRESILGLCGKRLVDGEELVVETLNRTGGAGYSVTMHRVTAGARQWVELLVCRGDQRRLTEIWEVRCDGAAAPWRAMMNPATEPHDRP